jgi:hypothetical protein
VDEAFMFWLDRWHSKSIDEFATSFALRHESREVSGAWSTSGALKSLIDQGRMHPAGLRAFQARKENRSGIYAYEQRNDQPLDEYAGKLRQNTAAWDFFQAQPAWYRKAAEWWVISAKKEETRLKRLEQLIEDSASGRTIPPLTRNKKPS